MIRQFNRTLFSWAVIGVVIGLIGVGMIHSDLSVEFLLYSSCVLGVLYCIRRMRTSKLGLFEFDVLFALALILYSFSYPISTSIRGRGTELSISAILAVSIGLLAFGLGAFAARVLSSNRRVIIREKNRPSAEWVHAGLLLFLCGLASYFLTFNVTGGMLRYFSLGYAERYLRVRDLGFITIWQGLATVGTVMLSYGYMSIRNYRDRRALLILALTIVCALIVILIELLSGKRRAILSMCIALLAVYCMKGGKLRRLFVLTGLPIAWVSISSFGYLRGLVQGSFIDDVGNMLSLLANAFSWSWLDPGRMEFGVAFSILEKLISTVPSIYDFWLGRSYLNALTLQIPSVFFPSGRPPSPTEWYASTFFPSVYNEGGGFGFFVVAEGYLNFGFLGIFVELFLVGYIGTRLEQQLLRTPVGELLYALFLPATVSFIRDSLGAFIKEFLIGKALPVIIVMGLLEIVSHVAVFRNAKGRCIQSDDLLQT